MEYKISKQKKERIIREFSELYYYSSFVGGTWRNTYWMGIPVQKYPTDMWIYQEIIYSQKINLIVETGTFKGGSALYFAHLLDTLGEGKIISIDIEEDPSRPVHSRINYISGSSIDDSIIKLVEDSITEQTNLLIILDSDHHKEHVLKELELYSRLVKINGYIIVEDTNLNGHPITTRRYGAPGPMEAVESFLETHLNFKSDLNMEKLYLTTNPKGFLRRVH